MPNRYLTTLIVAFWLATTGWFCYRDVWPRLNTGALPPFSIDLEEETRVPSMPASWMIERNGERIGPASTVWNVFYKGQTVGEALMLVQKSEDGDSYVVYQNVRFRNFKVPVPKLDVHPERLETMRRVNAAGEIQESESRVVFTAGKEGLPAVRIEVQLAGKVEDGQFAPEANLDFDHAFKLKKKLDPIEIRSNHSIFDPTHPWNRLNDLQEDRTWRIAYYDPLGESLKRVIGGLLPGLVDASEVVYLEAGVLSGTDDRHWDNRDVPCQVIEYRSEKITGKTWVRKSDGLVLRQEAEMDGEVFALERRPR